MRSRVLTPRPLPDLFTAVTYCFHPATVQNQLAGAQQVFIEKAEIRKPKKEIQRKEEGRELARTNEYKVYTQTRVDESSIILNYTQICRLQYHHQGVQLALEICPQCALWSMAFLIPEAFPSSSPAINSPFIISPISIMLTIKKHFLTLSDP